MDVCAHMCWLLERKFDLPSLIGVENVKYARGHLKRTISTTYCRSCGFHEPDFYCGSAVLNQFYYREIMPYVEKQYYVLQLDVVYVFVNKVIDF